MFRRKANFVSRRRRKGGGRSPPNFSPPSMRSQSRCRNIINVTRPCARRTLSEEGGGEGREERL